MENVAFENVDMPEVQEDSVALEDNDAVILEISNDSEEIEKATSEILEQAA